MSTFPTKHPDESFAIEIDFSKYTTALDTASVAIRVKSGTDAAPGDVLSGSVQIAGSKVRQRVIGGVDGVSYILKCAGTKGADTWVDESVLPVAALA